MAGHEATALTSRVGYGPVIAFALTILLGAFLVFQVQPIIGRHIPAWYGDTPAVCGGPFSEET